MPSQVKSGVENIVPETHVSMTNDRDFRTNLELNSLTSLLEIQQIENKNILSVIKNLVFGAVVFETQVKCRQLIIHLNIIWQSIGDNIISHKILAVSHGLLQF